MPIVVKPNEFFGHNFITRKVSGAFLDFISKHIFIERYNDEGVPNNYINPPVHFGHRERFISVVKSVTSRGENNQIAPMDINYVLPRMSLNVFGFNYDPERKINKLHKLSENADADSSLLARMIAPVPYSLDFELSILCKYLDDQFQIIEQIIPFFAPSLGMNINILGDTFEPDSILFSLVSTIPGGTDADFAIADDRVFETIMSFSAKVNYYYISRDGSMIRDLITRFNLKFSEADDDYKRFKTYEISANNLAPIYPIEQRDQEPTTDTWTYDEEDED